MVRPPAVDQAQPEEQGERDHEQHDGDRRRARRLSALHLPEDVDRGNLGLERLVARQEDHRAELAHGPGEAKGRPREYGRREGGQDDPPEGGEAARPQRSRRLLHVAVQLKKHRLNGPDDEREGDEKQRQPHGRLGVGDVQSQRALGTVEREQRQASYDGREGEGEVYDRVYDRLAPERVAHEYPGNDGPGDDVDGHDYQRSQEGEPEGGEGLRVGDRPYETADPVLCGLPHDRGERDEDQEAEVGDHHPAAGEAAFALWRGGPGRSLCVARDAHYSVGSPTSRSMSAMMLPSGSKNSSMTLSQPPSSSIVNRPGGTGKSNFLNSFSTTGR